MRFSPPKSSLDIFSGVQDGEERDRLIAALGHDLRGPLHVLGLSIQNLALHVASEEERVVLQAAEAAFDEVAALSDDLLDALRFGVGVVTPREDGLTLGHLFEDIRRRFRRRAELEQIDLRIVPTRIQCVADRSFIQRIVGNLVENAVKHAQASRVLVGARLRPGDRVTLSVVDDGVGIDAAELPFIFDEWYRGVRAKSNGTRGQGLGLWAVRRCVEAIGGSLCVDSVVGRGTMFTVEFNSFAKRLDRPAVLEEVAVDSIRSKVVAVLDDDADALRALRTSLESLGLRVVATTDDLQLLALVGQLDSPPDLFLLDFNLGNTTVERTLKLLKGKFGARLNAVVISGQAALTRSSKAVTDLPVISKPLSQGNLRLLLEVLSGARLCTRDGFG